jgi:hypothetical protein
MMQDLVTWYFISSIVLFQIIGVLREWGFSEESGAQYNLDHYKGFYLMNPRSLQQQISKFLRREGPEEY